MAPPSSLFLLLLLLLPLLLIHLPSSQSQKQLTCSSDHHQHNKQLTKNKNHFEHCTDLPNLNSILHWSYSPSKSSLSISFVAKPPSPTGWIAWAINPTSTGMIGAQTLIAFRQPDGSMSVKTYNVSSYKKVEPSEIAFPVPEMAAEYTEEDCMMRLYATIEKVGAMVNHVWQVGPVVDGIPAIHGFDPDSLSAFGWLDLVNGGTAGGDHAGDAKRRNRNIHGIVSGVSWGILFPVGVIIARYLSKFKFGDPAWFYLHVGCQISAYAIGVAGWATGLKLGSQSHGIVFTYHRNIGIAAFALATLQMFALVVRPKKDHKYRIYWDLYHHGIGYSIILLGIINVFKGLDILEPGKQWKRAYIIILILMGVAVVLLEATTWVVVLWKNRRPNT